MKSKFYIDALIGKNLKRIRTEKELSQEDIGNMIGIAKTKISAYENAKEGMGKEIMEKLCKGLHVEPYEFYLATNSPLIKDKKEQELLETYREIKKLDPAVAEEVIKYEKYRLKVSEEETDCPAPNKSKTPRHQAGSG